MHYCSDHKSCSELINSNIKGENTMENQSELTGYCQVVGCMNHIPSTNESPYCGLHMGEGLRHDPMLLTRQDYADALNSQTGCNVSGLLFSLNEIQHRINHTSHKHGYGTDWRNRHPIVRMFIHQISFLCGNGESIDLADYHRCREFCDLVCGEKLWPDYDYTKENWKA